MPVQKETIHLAIGPLPHHITTHFFNQQSSHFKYGNQPSSDSSDLILDPNVDFQEGIGSLRGEPTFFPRQIVIDFRQNFGTEWEAYNVVVDDEDDPESGVVSSMRAAEEVSHAWGASAEVLWAGDTSGKIQSTRYVSSRDDEEDDAESFLDTDEDKNIKSSSVQHLTSDVRQSPAIYSHNPSHPRSKYPLPRLFGSGSLAPMGNKSQEGQTPLSSFEMGRGNYERGHLKVLEVLTSTVDPGKQAYQDMFKKMQTSEPKAYYTLVYVDTNTDAIVAVGSLFIENKFIRNLGAAGHIEDIAVDKAAQGRGLGKKLINALTSLSESLGAYKVILDCSSENQGFYEKCGYELKGVQMAKYAK